MNTPKGLALSRIYPLFLPAVLEHDREAIALALTELLEQFDVYEIIAALVKYAALADAKAHGFDERQQISDARAYLSSLAANEQSRQLSPEADAALIAMLGLPTASQSETYDRP